MSASKQRGTRFERDVQNYLRGLGEECERLAQTGRLDEGDLVVRDEDLWVIAECKATQRIDLASFMDQALVERDNFAKARGISPAKVMPLAIVKRRGKSIKDAYVVTTMEEYWKREEQ